MLVVDAYTGQVVREGESVPSPDGGSYVITKIYPGFLRATADVIIYMPGRTPQIHKHQPLQVRWTHPDFMFRHVAFVPS